MPAGCGGSLSGTEGVVTFPGAGFSQYNHNVSCAWVITVPRGQVINITFSYFHLEGGSCRFDWLQVRNTPEYLDLYVGVLYLMYFTVNMLPSTPYNILSNFKTLGPGNTYQLLSIHSFLNVKLKEAKLFHSVFHNVYTTKKD